LLQEDQILAYRKYASTQIFFLRLALEPFSTACLIDDSFRELLVSFLILDMVIKAAEGASSVMNQMREMIIFPNAPTCGCNE